MACISYNNVWRREFYKKVSATDKEQVKILNQLKIKVNDAFKKDEKISTIFESSDDSDVINRAQPDTNLSKREGQVSFIEKDYNEFKLLGNTQSVKEVQFKEQ